MNVDNMMPKEVVEKRMSLFKDDPYWPCGEQVTYTGYQLLPMKSEMKPRI